MIELTRLNGTPIVLNSDLIKTCEASPDTMITLINGEKLIVREALKQVAQRTLNYRSQLLAAVAEKASGTVEPATIERYASLDASERAEQAATAAKDSLSRDR